MSSVVQSKAVEPLKGASPPHQHSAPLIKIRPRRSAIRHELKETWRNRELLYFLVSRDLKVRYRQTTLGVIWVVLQPLLMAVVFTVFLSKVGHFRTDTVPYPLFAYAGLLPWTFFSNSVLTSSTSLISNSYIITKVYFPRLIIPLTIVGVRLFDFLIASCVLFVLMFFYGVPPGANLLLLPALIALSTVLTFAVGAWFSAFAAKYRDVGTLLPVLIQIWMFVSPIIYPIEAIPERWRVFYSLNPLVGIVEGFRSSFFGLSFHWTAIAISAIAALAALACAVYAFSRWEDRLIDVL